MEVEITMVSPPTGSLPQDQLAVFDQLPVDKLEQTVAFVLVVIIKNKNDKIVNVLSMILINL